MLVTWYLIYPRGNNIFLITLLLVRSSILAEASLFYNILCGYSYSTDAICSELVNSILDFLTMINGRKDKLLM